MEDWVVRAMQRWPDVPALFGWLSLDRRGRWLIQGQHIRHPRIVDTINQNYGVDEHGRWYFQNGPQRGFIQLEYAPFVLRRLDAGDQLFTHTGLPIREPTLAYLDEYGALTLQTEHGPGEIAADELTWLLSALHHGADTHEEVDFEAILSAPSGTAPVLSLNLHGLTLPVVRLDAAALPRQLGFVRDPQALPGERTATRTAD